MRLSMLLAALSLSACTAAAAGDPIAGEDGSDGTDTPTPDPGPDPGPDPDSDPRPDPGAEEDGCPPDDLGTVDALKEASAFIDRMDPDDPDSPAVRILSGVPAPDVEFEIGLWDGYGAFADSPAAPGDYPITGDEADPDNCGICVELRMMAGEVEHRLIATGGAISIDSVDGDLEGSGTTLSFKEVDGDGELVSGGCASSITRILFDAPLGAPF